MLGSRSVNSAEKTLHASDGPVIGFVSGSADYAPYLARVEALRRIGFSVKVFAFERTWNPGPRLNAEYVRLGRVPLRRYLGRLCPLILSLPKIRKAALEVDILYAEGFDMMLLCLAGQIGRKHRRSVVYEVHDIRSTLVSPCLLSKVLRWIDRILVRSANLLVLTSPSYLTEYYEKRLGFRDLPHLILENKLDPARPPVLPIAGDRNAGVLRIGYFGSLRCPHSWRALVHAVRRSAGQVQVHVRGVPNGLNDFDSDIQSTDGLVYGGPYQNPRDLGDVYGSVDMVWVAGFNSKSEGGWARTCRFYESCYFRKPLIGQADTVEGAVIGRLNIGIIVDAMNLDDLTIQLQSVTQGDLRLWESHIAELPASVYLYTSEYSQLKCHLLKLKRSRNCASL